MVSTDGSTHVRLLTIGRGRDYPCGLSLDRFDDAWAVLWESVQCCADVGVGVVRDE